MRKIRIRSNPWCVKVKKRTYRDELAAQQALDQIQSQRGYFDGIEEKRFYACKFCSGYHLTSKEKRKK